MKLDKPATMRIGGAAAAAVRNGHPWVLHEKAPKLLPGTVVNLLDPNGSTAGWGLYDEGHISVRVLGRGPAMKISVALQERIFRADRARTRFLGADTNAYRVVNGAGDGLPGLIIDRYDGLAVVRIYSKAWELHLDRIVLACRQLPWLESVYRRLGVTRVDGMTGGVVLHGEEPTDVVVVSEYGMKLIARPLVGQKTGLFLDQREHRNMVKRWSAGRIVVNLFAYTGGFSVAAALGGAAHVTTVDIAADAVEDAKENFRLNGLDPAHHAFEATDAFRFEPVGSVGLMIVDPPALSRDKKSDGPANRAYRNLHKHVGRFVSHGGLLATSSCSARVDLVRWRKLVMEGLLEHGDWSWHWLSTEPPDHPVALGHSEAHYLKFGVLRRR